MTNSREPKTTPADSKWAAGYAAGKASLQAELDWHREEVARLSAVLPKQSGEWQMRADFNTVIEGCARLADEMGAEAVASAIRSMTLPAAPSPQEPKAVIADHGDTK